MRLLDTGTGEFVERRGPEHIAKFAILSHTWDEKGEQTYQELRDIQKRHAPGRYPLDLRSHHPRNAEYHDGPRIYAQHRSSFSTQPSYHPSPARTVWSDPELSPKIRNACAVARANGYQYLWIDSCCIDKTSSSELSEAINSMYQWYADAEVCYAFLADVPADEDHAREGSHFRRSRWFTRGWTLQELIAPAHVVFFTMDWNFMGSKQSLAYLVTQITGINYNALLRVEPLTEFSVAQRLSWAARRQTTRVEDRAYSLLGIFDINMPTLYGEGNRAFRRLQEEIMRRIPDQSLFAWTFTPQTTRLHGSDATMTELEPGPSDFNPGTDLSLLAPSVDAFVGGWAIEAISHDEVIRRLQYLQFPAAEYNFTPHGIRTEVPTIPLSVYTAPTATIEYLPASIPPSYWYLVILGCEHKYIQDRHLLGRVCYMSFSGSSTIEFVHCGRTAFTGPGLDGMGTRPGPWLDLLPLTIATVRNHLDSNQINLKSVYIPYPSQSSEISDAVRRLPHETIHLVLSKKTRDALQAEGYTANLETPNPSHSHHPAIHRFTLSLANEPHRDTGTITIEYQHILHRNGRALTIAARVTSWVSLASQPLTASSFRQYRQVDSRTVHWTDSLPWRRALGDTRVDVRLDTSQSGETLAMILNLHLATKDHYFLHIEFLNSLTRVPAPPLPPPIELPLI